MCNNPPPPRLQRGFKDAASHEHREPPIGHLVLIVHGIGQNMGSSDIYKDTCKSVTLRLSVFLNPARYPCEHLGTFSRI